MKLKRVMSIKSSGDDVLYLQNKLKEFGFFTDKVSGYYNQNTLMAVSNFQKHVGIKVTGEVNSHTWSKIINFNNKPINKNEIDNKLVIVTKNDLKIYDVKEEVSFYNEETTKKTILVSNTGFGYDPNLIIKYWKPIYKSETEILNKSSHFIIGRSSNITTKWDGIVLNTFDDKYWSYPYHKDIDSKSIISIDICNYGPLIKIDDNFYSSGGCLVDKDEVVELDYLGYNYYHKYTDNQIESLRKLIIYLQLKHGLHIERGNYTELGFQPFYTKKWFINYQPKLSGLKTKNNFTLDILGLSPQDSVINMLNTI